MFGSFKFPLAIVIASLLLPLAGRAQELSEAEGHYLIGYQSYLTRQFGMCADQFYLVDTPDSQLNRRAKLLLAYCQKALGLRAAAASVIYSVRKEAFLSWEGKMYHDLSQSLKAEIADLQQIHGSIVPYSAFGSFSPGSSKVAFSLVGAAGALTYFDWGFTLGGEYLNMQLQSPQSSGYTQEQFSFGVFNNLSPQWTVRANGTFISTTLTAYAANVFGGGITWSGSSGAALDVEFERSNYPNISLGALTVNQVTPTLSQVLWSSGTVWLKAGIAAELIFPSAPLTQDLATQFVLKSSYQRYVLDTSFHWDDWLFQVQGWTGSEAFGVRNQGSLVYNALEEHKFGWTGKVGYDAFTWLQCQLSYGMEDFVANGLESQLGVFVVSLIFKF